MVVEREANVREQLRGLRESRDHELAVLNERFLPRLRLLWEEWHGEREQVWARYRIAVDRLRAAA